MELLSGLVSLRFDFSLKNGMKGHLIRNSTSLEEFEKGYIRPENASNIGIIESESD